MQWLESQRVPGILDLTPGIRSLQIHYDSRQLPLGNLMETLLHGESVLPSIDEIEVPSRIVHLPLSWDDPSTRLAIEKYTQTVRPDAPWCPSNIEFIRRINGLADTEEVKRIVFDASYLVLGLGDVYLGAPVATPLDPRHRLVTTKYNPARTWTPQNAVGIGGAYMCIYGMEGPGGYQFVGRTVQVWNTYHVTKDFAAGHPWLLRFFDQVRFYPVSAAELLQLREDFLTGKFQLRVEETTFRLKEYQAFLAQDAEAIAAFRLKQRAAFGEERDRWKAAGAGCDRGRSRGGRTGGRDRVATQRSNRFGTPAGQRLAGGRQARGPPQCRRQDRHPGINEDGDGHCGALCGPRGKDPRDPRQNRGSRPSPRRLRGILVGMNKNRRRRQFNPC